EGPRRLLMSVKEQLRAIPGRGIGYGLLRYLSPDGSLREQVRMNCHPQVAFNYMGQLDQVFNSGDLFARAPEACGSNESPHNERCHLVTINAFVSEGCLNLTLEFSHHLHRRDTIERLAAAYRDSLVELIAHCLAPGSGGFTPSDFPLARLDQHALEIVLD